MQTTVEDYAEETLTPEETAEALRKGREEKHLRRIKEAWLEKIKSQNLWKYPNPRELYEQLLTTKSQTGRPFQLTPGNKQVVHALCLYFAGDTKFNGYMPDFSLDKGILLQGKPGVGKTHLMNFFAKNPLASYTLPTCKSIAEKYVKGWTRDEMNTIEFYSSLQSAPFGHPYNQDHLGTCFGDLGTENESKNYGNTRNVMEDIVFNRYEAKLPFNFTHFTTNLDADMIKNFYGERMLDRLREMCNVLFIDGDSFR